MQCVNYVISKYHFMDGFDIKCHLHHINKEENKLLFQIGRKLKVLLKIRTDLTKDFIALPLVNLF